MDINYIDKLRELLEVTGLSQTKLAGRLGVTFAALNRWLNNKSVPHPSTQGRINALHKELVGLLPIPSEILQQKMKELDQEKRRHKNIRQLLKANQNLRDDFLLELTYNSNAIEGSTLTKKETEAIIFDKAQIPDKSLIEHLEASNHAFVLESVFKGEFEHPLAEKDIKALHKMLMQGIRSDAGEYSKHHRAIRGVDLRLPAPQDIPEEMERLFRGINRVGNNHVIEHVAKIHASFEAIHPFGDGNGRAGRLIMIIQLLNAGYVPCVIENKRKAAYYEVLEHAQKKNDNQLIMFICESVQTGYKIVKKHHA